MKKDLLLSIGFLAAFSLSYLFPPAPRASFAPTMSATPVNEDKLFGIAVNNFEIEQSEVKRNQSLSIILQEFAVEYPIIHQLAENSKGVFDIRSLRTGKPYTAFTKKENNQLAYLVYEPAPAQFVVFDFEDSLKVYRGEKQVIRSVKTAKGEISSSLWSALVDAQVNPALANKMADVYAWTVDFFGLQKGDGFSVIYEEKRTENDNQLIGYGDILACNFHHNGQDYYAFLFEQDSSFSYFDDKGESLQKTYLKAPLKYSRISSSFSYSRMHPVLKYRRPHLGVDYAAPRGTPVLALGDGKVIKKAYSGGAGNMIKIKHNSAHTTGYLHLARFGKGIAVGSKVRQGQVIGYVGSTGCSTGPHLDFRFWKNGKAIDPVKVKAPPATPVNNDNLNKFNGLKYQLKQELDNIGRIAV